MARKKTNLVFDAVDYIRGKILSYDLKPGEPISDTKIALEMGEVLQIKISRSPVREAFTILQSEDFIEVIDGKVCVARITERDIFEICQLRDAIEQQSVIIVMNNGGFSQEEKELLKEKYQQLVKAIEYCDEEKEYQIDDEFHSILVACTKNKHIVGVEMRARNQMKRVRWLNRVFSSRRRQANLEHEAILNAILADDLEGTLQAIHIHNQNIMEAFQHIFETETMRKALVCLLSDS
ncbi:MAG: GntR family transcriptional regulator [Lachnospiraceae bacterium]|jgi:DNA-binding GntR family transcriptional regulator|nr:GntR family transcriptional regulator [Lachnospiraceae bacterium]